MRELKFRAWDTGAKRWASGVMPVLTGLSLELKPAHSGIIIEQYTGLKDKNGKEIYDGDIVKFKDRNYKVVFDNYGQFCLENRSYHWLENGYSFNSVSIWDKNQILVEVIGNIHENPELLDVKKEG